MGKIFDRFLNSVEVYSMYFVFDVMNECVYAILFDGTLCNVMTINRWYESNIAFIADCCFY